MNTSEKQRFLIEPPTIEKQFRRMLDMMGFHDAKSIPTDKAFEMFEAFFKHEHEWNVQLQKLLNETQNYRVRPLLFEAGKFDPSNMPGSLSGANITPLEPGTFRGSMLVGDEVISFGPSMSKEDREKCLRELDRQDAAEDILKERK